MKLRIQFLILSINIKNVMHFILINNFKILMNFDKFHKHSKFKLL